MACVVLTAIILVTNYAEEDVRTTGKLQSNEERAGSRIGCVWLSCHSGMGC